MTIQDSVMRDDIAQFLCRRTNLATLATYDDAGFPHLTPMWYLYEENHIWMWTWRNRQKYRNITENCRKVGIFIQDSTDQQLGVILTGYADILTDQFELVARKIIEQHVPADEIPIWMYHVNWGKGVIIKTEIARAIRNGSSWNI